MGIRILLRLEPVSGSYLLMHVSNLTESSPRVWLTRAAEDEREMLGGTSGPVGKALNLSPQSGERVLGRHLIWVDNLRIPL